jgi:UDP-3-O-[3-hydroxymyristoyl] glucosamine N-acyltransferase
MVPGLVFFDLLALVCVTSLWSVSAWVAWWAFGQLVVWLPLPVVVPLAALAGLSALILMVGVVHRILPRIEPGRYRIMKDPMFFVWVSRFILNRALFAPGLQVLLFQFNTLRFFSLRALGAKVSFSTSMSSDAVILDPWLLEAGPGATVGTGCLVSGHFIDDGRLVLGRVVLGEGSLLAARVMVAPGARIGARARVLAGVMMGVGVEIGERAVVGADVGLEGGVVVAPGVRLGSSTFVHKGARVDEDTPPKAVIGEPPA